MMWIRGIKLSIGGTVGILIAYFLGLTNPLTAGTIVLLSLGKTRRSSLASALIRVKSVIVALMLASGAFLLLGFTIYSFALFLCLYVFAILIFKLDEGLIIGAVLSGQIWGRGVINGTILLNAIFLFIIGVCIAFLFNLYMPDMSKQILKDQRHIENSFRNILAQTADLMRGVKLSEASLLIEIETFIEEALSRAKLNDDNYLRLDKSYYAHYIQMRKLQLRILKRMYGLASKVDMMLIQVDIIADLTDEVAKMLSESGNGEEILEKSEMIATTFKNEPLPGSRQEFENRAILFQYLSELRHMVELKREFNHEYGDKS